MNRGLGLIGIVALSWAPFVPVDSAHGHAGRKFLVEVVNGKLQVQGVNTGVPDGAPASRPYINAIHDHWQNITPPPGSGLEPRATSFLPDYEIQIGTAFVVLREHEVTLDLVRASQWVNPPPMPMLGTVPDLQPLDLGEVIQIEAANTITTDTLGTLLLSASVPPSGIEDILVNYSISGHPAAEIHVLEFRMSATPTNPNLPDRIADSNPIFVVLSPDGENPVEKLHHTSLFLAEYLAAQSVKVPEPATLAMGASAFTLLAGVRRDQRGKRFR